VILLAVGAAAIGLVLAYACLESKFFSWEWGVPMMTRQSGFTLIELMIVVAIIAILAAIALPAYQDYIVRAQVTEGLSLSTEAKFAVADYYASHGDYPTLNTDAGLAAPTSITSKFVSQVSVDNTGLISVAFSSSANAKLHGTTLTLQPTQNGGSVSWRCGGLPTVYLPQGCK